MTLGLLQTAEIGQAEAEIAFHRGSQQKWAEQYGTSH
jgi:hypothetical protein